MASGLVVAVVGVTGAVGQTTLKILEERKFPVRELRAFASARSAGKTVTFKGETVRVEAVGPRRLQGRGARALLGGIRPVEGVRPAGRPGRRDRRRQVQRLPDGSRRCRWWCRRSTPHAVKGHRGILACPNCTTIVTVMPLKPLHQAGGLRRVIATSYQAVSGAGVNGVEELRSQTLAWARGEAITPRFFPHQIAFNVIPHIDKFGDDGYTGEEIKLVNEVRKILELPDLRRVADHGARAGLHRALGRGQRGDGAQGQPRAGARGLRGIPRPQALGRSGARAATRCRCSWKGRTSATWDASARTSPSRTRSTSGWWATSSARAPRSTASRSRSC